MLNSKRRNNSNITLWVRKRLDEYIHSFIHGNVFHFLRFYSSVYHWSRLEMIMHADDKTFKVVTVTRTCCFRESHGWWAHIQTNKKKEWKKGTHTQIIAPMKDRVSIYDRMGRLNEWNKRQSAWIRTQYAYITSHFHASAYFRYLTSLIKRLTPISYMPHLERIENANSNSRNGVHVQQVCARNKQQSEPNETKKRI